MNRELRFRAWDGLRITTSGLQFCTTDGKLTMIGNGIPMQFTGLKDKNGKEIYEGDVVKIVAGTMHPRDTLCEVRWYQRLGQWRLNAINEKCFMLDCWDLDRSFEAIGNIYENPELLNITPQGNR